MQTFKFQLTFIYFLICFTVNRGTIAIDYYDSPKFYSCKKVKLIRSTNCLFYTFIPLSSPTQKIMKKLQTLQTRTLRQIKYFPLKTKTSEIIGYFNLDSLETRTSKLLAKFNIGERKHELIERELATYKEKVYPIRKGNSKQNSTKCSTWLVDRGTKIPAQLVKHKVCIPLTNM